MEQFYAHLPVCDNFLDIADPSVYSPVPPSWYIAIADVRGSTAAIEQGRYKEVNLVGASAIVALLNLAGGLALPFVFGGDGATVLLPPSLEPRARAVLLATQAMARDAFNLDLRVGLVPVADVIMAGQALGVARFRISDQYEQAMFMGGGLSYAEQLVKEPLLGARYQLAPEGPVEADFSGLECRWQDLPSPHGEMVTLLVKATTQESDVYRAVLQQIERCYGTEEQYRPVRLETLRPSFDPRRLLLETRVRVASGWRARQHYLWEIWARNLLLKLFVRHKVEAGGVRWDHYVEALVGASDYKKYDETLRMVLAGTAAQRERLTDFLEAQSRAGALVYGLHVSDRALLTCVVFERLGPQVHFVDGADGGYALAARALKQRLAVTALPSTPHQR